MTIDQDMIMIHVPEVVPVISHVYVHDRDCLNSVEIPITMTVYTTLYQVPYMYTLGFLYE